MPLDTAWMDGLSEVGAHPAVMPGGSAPSFPVVGAHPAPDGTGAMTNLSDADYAKFIAGQKPEGKGSTKSGDKAPAWTAGLTEVTDHPALEADKEAAKYPVRPDQQTGMLANAGAGTSEAVAGTLGAPVDLATGAINLGLRGAHALAGPLNRAIGAPAPPAEAPQITNPVGGSESVKSLFGAIGADPRRVAPSDGLDKLARAAGSDVASMVIPWAGARALPALTGIPGAVQQMAGSGSAAGQAAIGTGAGVGGDIAEEVAPEPLKPIANFAGQMVGGGVVGGANAGLKAATDLAKPIVSSFTAPLTKAGQQRLAAQRVAGAASNPAAVREALANPSPELVPGSAPTTYQATADPGLGTLERGVSRDRRYAPQFDERRGAQNNARVAAIEGQAPEDANASQIGPWFRARLGELNAAHEGNAGSARAVSQSAVDAMGNPITPHQAGATVRDGVAATHAPEIAQSDAAIAGAQERAEGAVEGLGGNPAQQSVQAHGNRMRGVVPADEAPGAGLEGARKPVRDAAGRLLDAVDPDGTLAIGLKDFRSEASDLRRSINERMGDRLAPAEQPVWEAIGNLRDVELFSDFRALMKATSKVQREIRADPSLGAESEPARRMRQLQSLIDDALQQVVEDQGARDAKAVAAGIMAPENAIQARLQAELQGGQPNGAGAQGTRNTAGTAAAPSASGGGSANTPTGQRSGTPAGNSTVAAGPADRLRKPESLVDFLIARGGVRDQTGDLAAIGADAIHHQQGGRLVSERGATPDYAREAAEEAGFLRPGSTINDLYDAVADHASGRPTYRAADMSEAVAHDAGQRASAENARAVAARERANSEILMAESDAGVRLSDAEIAHATELRMQGMHPHQAIAEAVVSGEEAGLEKNAQQNAFGQPGVPLAAQQAEMPMRNGSVLTPNFDRAARDRLRAANAAYRNYKEAFRTGAVGDVLASGRNANGYRLTDSQVPPALFNGGAKGAEAADGLIKASGSREEALKILGDYPAFSLRSKAEEMGTLSVPKYEDWLKTNKAVMDKFPELRAQFDTAAKARSALDDLRTKRAAIDKAYPINPGWGDAEVMDRLVVPGPKGYEAAGNLVRETGASPAARMATEDYLASSLREAAEVKSGPNAGTLDQGAYDRWMKKYDSFLLHPEMADVRARFQSAGSAQEALDRSLAAHVEARKQFDNSVARHFLGEDADPVTSVGRILRSSHASEQMADLARLTAGDPAARHAVQRAVIEHVLRELRSNNPVGGDLSQMYLKSDALQSFIKRHVTEGTGGGALRRILEPDQIEALNNVALDLKRSNLSNTANKAPAGSDTALNQSAHGAVGHQPSMVGMLAAMEVAGEAAGHIGGPFARIAGMVGVPMLNAMRRAGFEHVDDLVAEALLHPDKMAALLAKMPSAAAAPSRAAALASQIRALAVVAAGSAAR